MDTMRHQNPKITKLAAAALAVALFAAAAPAALAAEAGKVNVNKASAEQLALLPRVGPSIAARIVEFREENGEFAAPEDLMLVRGIGEKTFELLEPYVALSGATTLSAKVRTSRSRDAGGDEESGG